MSREYPGVGFAIRGLPLTPGPLPETGAALFCNVLMSAETRRAPFDERRQVAETKSAT
jgi:hypothetical protein